MSRKIRLCGSVLRCIQLIYFMKYGGKGGSTTFPPCLPYLRSSFRDDGDQLARYWCLWTKLKINENKMKIEKGKREEGKGKQERATNRYTMPTSHSSIRQLGLSCGTTALSSCQKGRNSTKFTIFDELVRCNSTIK